MYKQSFPNVNVMNSFQGDIYPNNNQIYQSSRSPYPGSHYPMPRQPFDRQRLPLNRPNNNEEHWCETCDRSFFSHDLLEKHKQQHQIIRDLRARSNLEDSPETKCNIDGCQFIAHPKVITKHIQMQHASGLYKKIAKLNNPEEIQKWREERKKKYPTKVNIDKKAAEIKEKIDRGEKIGLNTDRQKRQFNKGKGSNIRRNENNQRNKQRLPFKSSINTSSFKKIKKPVLPKKITRPVIEDLRKLKPFGGIQNIVLESSAEDIAEDTNCSFVIEDDCEDFPMQQKSTKDSEPKVCGALSSLMCDYDFSDDEEDNTKVEETVNKATKPENIQSQTNNIPEVMVKHTMTKNNETGEKSDDDGPEEIKINKTIEAQSLKEPNKSNDTATSRKKNINEKNHTKNKFTRPKYKIPSTLLQKLLKREMQHERNIVLQCVRHIVKNNYFDKNK